MFFSNIAFVSALSLLAAKVQAQSVVAHFIVGNAKNYQAADWDADIKAAADAGIEGFSLNIGDPALFDTQVPLAYDAAQKHGKFGMFLQFDFGAYSGWDMSATGQVQTNINTYAAKTSQFNIDGKALVSTFEGSDQSAAWNSIIASTGILLAPDWTSAKAAPATFDGVAGALSWDVWPYGAKAVDSAIDTAWQAILGSSKTYIMGVSPWFYTDLPDYSKNWVVRNAGLWHDRWTDVMAIKPPVVEILTWNDFGESHYVGPNTRPACFPSGSSDYVAKNSHAGFLATLPAYIQAYKSGNSSTTQLTELLAYAHTTNPVNPQGSCQDGGATALNAGGPGQDVVIDAIDVYVVVNSPADVTVTVGGKDSKFSASLAGINYFQVLLDGASGEITYSVSRNGAQVLGGTESPGISTDCSGFGGKINFNAVTGSYVAGASS